MRESRTYGSGRGAWMKRTSLPLQMLFAAVHESGIGTKLPIEDVRFVAAFGA